MKRIFILIFILVMSLLFTSCGGDNTEPAQASSPESTRFHVDREGYAVTLPNEINTIISIGPAVTEILTALGFGNQIIATDMFSAGIDGLNPDAPTVLDMMALDAEYIVSLMPDVVFITGMTRVGADDDPLSPVSAAGITVVYMPVSSSIADIITDIHFLAAIMESEEAGARIVGDLQTEIDNIRNITAAISEPKKVYFEIEAAPWMFSFGRGTFLHEMVELAGGVNIFADEEGWIGVSDEMLLEANPDVIFTTTDYLDDPIGEIKNRPGFDVITAVQNGDVYQINADAASRPSHHIITALKEMAAGLYPEYFR
jgi:iron complex transport system substrate-binding protein